MALVVVAACGGGQISNLPLMWQGVEETPRPSAAVERSFAAAPFAFGLRDLRPDLTAVGVYEGDGFVVRTSDNVAQYCSDRFGELLVHAGARLNEPPVAVLEVELLEYNVVEGGNFNGAVRVRAIVRRGAEEAGWRRTYTGKSKRWGRTHNPENFNEALSNALVDVASQLMKDDDFANALIGQLTAPPPAVPPYPSAPAPYPSAPAPYPSAPAPYPSAPAPYPSAPAPAPAPYPAAPVPAPYPMAPAPAAPPAPYPPAPPTRSSARSLSGSSSSGWFAGAPSTARSRITARG